MARRMARVIDGELRDAVVKIGNTYFFSALLQNVVETTEIKGREILAIGIARTVLYRAGNANHALDARIVRGDLRISDRPVHVVAVERSSAKIDVAKSSGGSPPKVRFSANRITAGAGPDGSGNSGELEFVFPHTRHPFVVHEADGLRALRRIAETAELHLPGLAMIAKILCGIEPAPRVDTANFEASFTERLDGRASARAASNHNDVKNLFWHCGSPFGRRQMLVFGVIGMRAGWRVRIELQCWIVDFLVANFGGVKTYDC